MGEFLFFAEGHAFCAGCREAGPLLDELGGKSASLSPAQMCKLAARHLRVMPRTQPRLDHVEAFKAPKSRKRERRPEHRSRGKPSTLNSKPNPLTFNP